MSERPGSPSQLLAFTVADLQCGLDAPRVERVLRMVALTPLPKAPPVILGAIDLHGEVIPVAGVRERFGRGTTPVALQGRLIVVNTARRKLALAVDAVAGLVDYSPAVVHPADAVSPGLEHLQGIARLPELGLVLIHDIDRFLSLSEEHQVAAALAAP